MHTLRIREDNDAKRLAAFWVIEIREYKRFELNPTYLSWNIKVIYNEKIIKNLK